MSSQIIFNGKAYSSVEEMPADVRPMYERMMGIFADKNQNGVPDILEGQGLNLPLTTVNSLAMQSTTIVYEGKAYNNVDELPPAARAKYEQALGALADKNHDGLPAMLETALTATTLPTAALARPATAASSRSHMPHDPTQAEAGGQKTLWLGVGIAVVVLLLIIAALLAVLVFQAFMSNGSAVGLYAQVEA